VNYLIGYAENMAEQQLNQHTLKNQIRLEEEELESIIINSECKANQGNKGSYREDSR